MRTRTPTQHSEKATLYMACFVAYLVAWVWTAMGWPLWPLVVSAFGLGAWHTWKAVA